MVSSADPRKHVLCTGIAVLDLVFRSVGHGVSGLLGLGALVSYHFAAPS